MIPISTTERAAGLLSVPTDRPDSAERCLQRSLRNADDVVISTAAEPTRAPADEHVSPELVLVDPSLANRERQRIPVAPVVRTGPRELRVVGQGRDTPEEIRARMRDLGGGGRVGASVAIASTVLAIFSLTEVQIQFGDRTEPAHPVQQALPQDPPTALQAPSLAEPPKRQKAASTQPKTKKRVSSAPPSSASRSGRTQTSDAPPQRFAWAPTPGASAYRVELFRSGIQVFAAATRQPVMTLPRRWTFEGRSHSLEAGMYTWYVWAVENGRRATQATVQARLSVPSR